MERELSSMISKDEVIAKIKDDGDFDRLRLIIIRKLKDNEELRNKIISTVKESKVINRPGSETLKPRQLSDAIHDEVGNNIMAQISDGLWEIIRSPDGVKNEIAETVQSVYDKILNPNRKEVGQSSAPVCVAPVPNGLHINGFHTMPANEIADTLSDNEPNEPPGFAFVGRGQSDSQEKRIVEPQLPLLHEKIHSNNLEEEAQCSKHLSVSNSVHFYMSPGKQLSNHSDEDPDVPPEEELNKDPQTVEILIVFIAEEDE